MQRVHTQGKIRKTVKTIANKSIENSKSVVKILKETEEHTMALIRNE